MAKLSSSLETELHPHWGVLPNKIHREVQLQRRVSQLLNYKRKDTSKVSNKQGFFFLILEAIHIVQIKVNWKMLKM